MEKAKQLMEGIDNWKGKYFKETKNCKEKYERRKIEHGKEK